MKKSVDTVNWNDVVDFSGELANRKVGDIGSRWRQNGNTCAVGEGRSPATSEMSFACEVNTRGTKK